MQPDQRLQPLPPLKGVGQLTIVPEPVVGAVRPAVGATEDDEDDDAPLSTMVVAKKKEPTAAEAAEARAEQMLDRMKQREQLRKSQKAAAAKDAADGGDILAVEDAALKRGPGRPRGVGVAKKTAPDAEEAVVAPPPAKRVRIMGKSSPT